MNFLKTINKKLSVYGVRILNFFRYHDPFIFTNVIIDISTICNRKCRYCPMAYYPRKHIKMQDALFYKIIDQLAGINYKDEIKIGGGWSEPLLDERLPQFIRYARARCPESFIYTGSNGDFLNIFIFKKLIEAGLSYIQVSGYDQELKPDLQKLSDSLGPDNKKRIKIQKFRPERADNRAGALKELEIKKPLKMKCSRPDYQMFINAEGKVVLCCNDYFEAEIMGDANKESIFAIWHNNRFAKIRTDLRKGKRENVEICSKCNYSRPHYRLPRKHSSI